MDDGNRFEAAGLIVTGAGGYLALGAVFGLVYVIWLAGRLDPGARGAGIGFRLIILPAAVLIWPWLLVRVLTPAERRR
jgi:hypothetical protein